MGLSLVTKAEFKAYAGITSTTQDEKIDIIIPKVSELVKSICGRTFVDYVNDTKTEIYDGGTNYHTLLEFPVLAVSSVEYSSDFGKTYTTLEEYTDYVVNARSSTIESVSGKEFPLKTNSFRITYTAGYEVLPQDLKLAVLDLVSYYLRNDMAVHSNRAPGANSVQIEYVTTTALPAHIARVLDLYKTSLI